MSDYTAQTPDSIALAAPPLERRRLQAYLVQLLGDGAMLLLGFAAAGALYVGEPFGSSNWAAGQLTLPLFWTVALLNRTYSIHSLVHPIYAVQRAAMALTAATLLQAVLLFLARSSLTVSRFSYLLGLGLGMVLILWLRANMQPMIRRWVGPRATNVLVIEAGGPTVTLEHGFRINAAAAGIEPTLGDPHVLDRLAQATRNMDRVIVSCGSAQRGAWSMVLKSSHIRGEIVACEVEELGVLGTSRSDGVPTLIVAVGPLGLRARLLKRAMDLALSLFAIAILALPMLLVAILVRLEDGGPALFVQRRVGRSNQFFAIYKFRTLWVAAGDQQGARSVQRSDYRVTRIGAFLRRSSMDELPQLFNVLKGEMSLVGPRPHALASLAGEKLFWQVDDRYAHRHALKPGMTGLAQLRGLRGETPLEQDLAARLQADLEYHSEWSLWRDVTILLGTIRVVLGHRAA